MSKSRSKDLHQGPSRYGSRLEVSWVSFGHQKLVKSPKRRCPAAILARPNRTAPVTTPLRAVRGLRRPWAAVSLPNGPTMTGAGAKRKPVGTTAGAVLGRVGARQGWPAVPSKLRINVRRSQQKQRQARRNSLDCLISIATPVRLTYGPGKLRQAAWPGFHSSSRRSPLRPGSPGQPHVPILPETG